MGGSERIQRRSETPGLRFEAMLTVVSLRVVEGRKRSVGEDDIVAGESKEWIM